MNFSNRDNEKGFALISVYMVAVILLGISGATFSRAFIESREISREITRQQIRAGAEAGLQNALAQIGAPPATNFIAYSGYIDITPLALTMLDTNQNNVKANDANVNFNVTFDYPNQADWVIVTATANAVGGDPANAIRLEGRVFLDSNFSKYMVYANTPTVRLGNNLQLGFSDGVNPQGVPANELDRNMLYYTCVPPQCSGGAGNLSFSGGNVQIYGDVNAKGSILGNASSWLHGDAYTGSFSVNGAGQVTTSGVTANLKVGDGFSDDTDRNGDGFINAQDYPDYHGLTQSGGGDSHKEEIVAPLDLNFYAGARSIPGANGIDVVKYGGGNPRYFKFETGSNGTTTRVVEYSSAGYQTVIGTRDLQNKNGIVYVKGDIFVKGEVKGRVTVVSSNNIYYAGDVKYSGNSSYVVNPNNSSSINSVAFLAKNQHYFLPNSVEVSGIVYGEKAYDPGPLAIVASQKLDANFQPVPIQGGEKFDGHFRHYGNIVMNGTADTAVYLNDRAYLYDKDVKYYRPPGLPVAPNLRLVREA